jgi:hypothetical protein
MCTFYSHRALGTGLFPGLVAGFENASGLFCSGGCSLELRKQFNVSHRQAHWRNCGRFHSGPSPARHWNAGDFDRRLSSVQKYDPRCLWHDAHDVLCFAIKHIEDGFRQRVSEFVDQPANLANREMLAVKQCSRFRQSWTPIEIKSLYGAMVRGSSPRAFQRSTWNAKVSK